jgi:hypothetical protein
MAKNYSGRDFLLYVGTTAPTAASSAADAAYALVGSIRNVSFGRSRNAIDKSSKADGDDSSFIAGRRNQTLSFDGLFDHTEDAGYTKLSDAYESAGGAVYFLATSTTTGDTEWHGNGVITQLDVAFPDEDVSTFTSAIQVSGALTEVVGTST